MFYNEESPFGLFMEFLKGLLESLDPDDPGSVARAKDSLSRYVDERREALLRPDDVPPCRTRFMRALWTSDERDAASDRWLLETMESVLDSFEGLARHRDEFLCDPSAGFMGAGLTSLAYVVAPHC